jgi:xanthine dehydrogenase small subunit
MLDQDVAIWTKRLGSAQVRATGTIGGNIANGSPIGDSPPLLIALGARLHLRRGGISRSMPLEDFFLAYGRQDRAPGEIVTHVTVPKPDPREQIRVFKLSKRIDQDISSVLCAMAVRLEGRRIAAARIAFGGMAGIPRRASLVEAALTGLAVDDDGAITAAAARLGSDFTPLDDHRASARYRLEAAMGLIRKGLVEIATGTRAATRIAPLQGAGHAA